VQLVAYVRTSTANPGNGDSPAAQEEACWAWATASNLDIAAVHIDRGLSGKLGPDDRPGLAAALVAVERGDADGLVVHRLDRLARELHVQEAALARAWEAGGRVFEAVEGEVPRDDPDDPYRRFVRQVMGAAAELERGMIAARLRTGRRRKRERGGYAGGPTVPFGQRVEGEGTDARLAPDPQGASTVASILQLRRSELTLAAIAQRLNAEGIPSARGGRWHASSVRCVLLRAEQRAP
jgi:DNA invertase Pin-like site-specific DNA recombinase